MTVFKTILKIFASYWVTILIYLVIFLGFAIVLIGRPENDTNQQFEGQSLDIAVVNHSNHELSTAFISYLDEQHNVIDLSANPIEDVRNDLFSDKYSALIEIPSNFEELIFQSDTNQVVITSNERDMAAPQIISAVDNYLRLLNAFIASGETEIDVLTSRLQTTLAHETEVAFATNNESTNVESYYKVGITLLGFILMQMIMGVVSMTMISLKRENIQQRISISGYSLKNYNKEVILGQLSFGGVLFPLIMLFLILYIPSSVNMDYVRIGISIFIFSLVCLALSFLLTSITTNRTIVSAVTLVISLGLAFVSGVFIPYELLGSLMQRLAYFSPLFYYSQSITKQIESYADLTMEWGIMLVFCVVFVLLGVAVSKQKQYNKV